MMHLISRIFGKYAYQVVILGNGYIELLICTLLFCFYFKRKKFFALRFAAVIAFSFAVCLLMAFIRTNYTVLLTRFTNSVIINALPLLLVLFCFEENLSEKLICWCGGIAAQQVSASIVSFIYAAFGVDDATTISFFPIANETRDWLIYYAMHILLYVLCSLLFSRKKRTESESDSMRNIVLLSVAAIAIVSLITNVNREYESDSLITRMVIKALLLLCFTFILILRTGIFERSRYKQELRIMDQLMYEEKKQFESVKSNIDVINMKCHDLKHRLSELEGRLTENEVESLKEAIKIYDSSLNSGNEILDVVLYEKQLICEKEKIRLSCMADGKALTFMTSPHVYSLFSNALNNAIEAVKSLPEEMRAVSLVVNKEQGLCKIDVINYYCGECVIVDGLPQTSKEDKVHHGWGVKSIRHVASLYGGSAAVSTSGGIFELSVVFPCTNS